MNRNQPVKTLVDKIWNDQSYGDSIKQNLAFIDIVQENRLALFMIGKSYFFLSDIKLSRNTSSFFLNPIPKG